MPTIEKIRVRYGETDKMGHAYYANYLYWFEQARGAWCRDRGFTYKQMEEDGILLPCVEANLKYRSEVLYDDLIEVHIWISEIRRASVRFEYKIFQSENKKLCTEGYTWHVFMSKDRKVISINDHYRGLFENDLQKSNLKENS